jgi:hypothetical protein
MMIVAFRVLIGSEGGRGAETVVAAEISPGSVSEAVVVAMVSLSWLMLWNLFV